jgi:hypothetical protein
MTIKRNDNQHPEPWEADNSWFGWKFDEAARHAASEAVEPAPKSGSHSGKQQTLPSEELCCEEAPAPRRRRRR